MSFPEIEFIGWNKSALELVAERLNRLAAEEPDAFRRATVVVPTAESGRRLRERMAESAGKPILMPGTRLVGQLIEANDETVASEPETLATWVNLLMEDTADAQEWQDFFPRPARAEQAETWAVDIAECLMQLRQQLEQYDVTVEGLLRRIAERDGLPQDFLSRWDALQGDEYQRWRVLQKMFDTVDQRLAVLGKIPPSEAREHFIAQAPQGKCTQLILACIPELSAQTRRFLLHYAGRVRILVNAPAELRELFDDFGCVLPDAWAERELPPGAVSANSLVITPSAQALAQEAVNAVGVRGVGSQEVVLGVCDASFTPALVTEFEQHGWRVNVPEGRAFRASDLATLPSVLRAACCAEDPLPITLAEPLLRNVAVQRLCGGCDFDSFRFTLLLDKIVSLYLPDDFDMLSAYLDPTVELPGYGHEVRAISELRCPAFFEAVSRLRSLVREGRRDIRSCLRSLAEHLGDLYRDDPLAAAALQMAHRARELVSFLQLSPLPPLRAWSIAEHLLADQGALIPESARRDSHLDALGWRELAFADGKLLLLTGLHDHCVPEAPPADPFLPDSLRQVLGMPCLRSREARDCFLLSALLSRDSVRDGGLRIILSRSSADGQGSPVQPSLLLYHCGDAELVDRVKFLYRDLPPEGVKHYSLAWSLAQPGALPSPGGMESVSEQLVPGWSNKFADPEHRFSPSDVSSFLACPLRFWVKQALGISPWDTYNEDKMEADAAQHGSLLHSVLEYVGKMYGSKESLGTYDDMYRDVQAVTRQKAMSQYGGEVLPKLVQVQLVRFCDVALRSFLHWHREQIADLGWLCMACELRVDDWVLPLPDGSTAHVAMRIDRIDYHPDQKLWRIIDYKSHGRTPFEDHLEKVMKPGDFREKMGEASFPLLSIRKGHCTGDDGHPHRWRDVQLPLYALWLMQEKKCNLPQVGYYNLPRGGKDAPGYNEFKEFDSLAADSALLWAQNAILLMRTGKCLFSAESLGCKGFGSFSENVNLADPRQLFHTLKPSLSQELSTSCTQEQT